MSRLADYFVIVGYDHESAAEQRRETPKLLNLVFCNFAFLSFRQ